MGGVKTRVAVLGGGVGGLTAAFELTRPDLDGRFDVTVYQLGWRLGGKGASGRNPARGHRIEEHGLHIWFGFYANAFRLMHDVYAELGRPPEAPLGTVDKAFKACPTIVLYDRIDGIWHSVPGRMPRRGDDPWTEGPSPAAERSSSRPARARPGAGVAPRSGGRRVDARRRCGESRSRSAACRRDRRPGRRRARTRPAGAEADRAGSAPRARLRARRMGRTAVGGQAAPAADLHHPRRVRGGGDGDPRRRRPREGLRRHRRQRLGRVARAPRRVRKHTIGATPADRAPVLRSVYDVAFCFPRRQGEPGRRGRRHRDERPAQARPRLPRRVRLQDDRGDGRRDIRARSTRSSASAGSRSASSMPSPGCDPRRMAGAWTRSRWSTR